MNNKFTTLAVATLIASSTLAHAQKPAQQGLAGVEPLNLALQFKAAQGAGSKASFKPVSDEVITKAPAGTAFDNVNRKGRGFFNSKLGIQFGNFTCTLADYVKGDDGNVYLKNPYSQKRTNSFLKLEKLNGDTLIARMPQAISFTEKGNKTYAMKLKLYVTKDKKFTYFPDTLANNTVNSDVKFIMRGDTIKQLSEGVDANTSLPTYILGEVNDKAQWTRFGDDDVEFTLIHEKLHTLPQGAKLEKYQLKFADDTVQGNKLVQVAFMENQEVYVSNPALAGQWIKGTINNDKAEFPLQYMGRNETENCHQYMVPATFVHRSNGNDYSPKQILQFAFDKQARTLTTTGKVAWVLNAGKDVLSPNNKLGVYDTPQLYPYTEASATPVPPVIVGAMPDDTGMGGNISFTIKHEDTNGQYIDENKLFYEVYFDDKTEPYEFPTNMGTLSRIPATYKDSKQFFFYSGVHYIIQIPKNFTYVGMRTIFNGGNVEKISEMAWWPNKPGAINSIASNKTVKEVVYYDIMGRIVPATATGMRVKVTRYTDGTKTTEKLIN